MSLVKDNTGFSFHLFGYYLSNFWIQQIVITVDNNIGLQNLKNKASVTIL